ncbi:hypothetical protein FGO68_gene7109 [Halteria grandinella]|uniref:Uncharacterized protein n=1 Tax=Halteria grandinella TaxID=5974 RepID=A0A8J8NTD1_HALGN|nr:hypothetical protein FGO68_gene7109 [Halteria grandinella]
MRSYDFIRCTGESCQCDDQCQSFHCSADLCVQSTQHCNLTTGLACESVDWLPQKPAINLCEGLPCTSHSECAGFCILNPFTNRFWCQKSMKYCTSDNNCPQEMRCASNACVERTCQYDSDCPGQLYCRSETGSCSSYCNSTVRFDDETLTTNRCPGQLCSMDYDCLPKYECKLITMFQCAIRDENKRPTIFNISESSSGTNLTYQSVLNDGISKLTLILIISLCCGILALLIGGFFLFNFIKKKLLHARQSQHLAEHEESTKGGDSYQATTKKPKKRKVFDEEGKKKPTKKWKGSEETCRQMKSFK